MLEKRRDEINVFAVCIHASLFYMNYYIKMGEAGLDDKSIGSFMHAEFPLRLVVLLSI